MILGIILGGFGLLFGIGSAATAQFERQAASDISSKLSGTARHVKVATRSVGLNAISGHLMRVTISADSFSTPGLPLYTQPDLPKSGKVDELRIDLSNFDLGNLHVARLLATIPNCRYDFGLALRKRKIRLSNSGTGIGSVDIRAVDLESFIVRKFPEIKSVHVQVSNGKIEVSGYGEFLIIHTNFRLIANLTSPNGSQLLLKDAIITFDGKAADDLSQRALLRTLNPVVDLNKDLKLLDAISIVKITLDNETVHAEGAAKIPVEPHLSATS